MTVQLGKYDECSCCGAVLENVPVDGDNCPHCGYDLVNNPPTFGSAQRRMHPSRLRDDDPDTQAARPL